MTDELLQHFFAPKGVAVIGASQDPNKLGYGLARNILQGNYPGAVHLVNPKGGMLLGKAFYRSVLDVPDPVDLAVILIPAPAIPNVLRECGRRGIPAAIISSGGFRETGEAGAALERECAEIAHEFGIRLIGPNCVGVVETHLPLNTTFLSPPGPPAGEIAYISQSGAICASVVDWARGQGFGLSRLVSLGNQVDLKEADFLVPVAKDPFTRVLTLYLENVYNGRHFVEQAIKVSPQKPILAIKVGRFQSGQKAAASHTGALAGKDAAYEAAFRRAGVIRAETIEELFDWARTLAWCPPPAGRGVAVLTNAGGPGVTAADAVEMNGLHMANLSQETMAALRKILPPAANVTNPIDLLGTGSPEQYVECLKILLADDEVHSVLVILLPPPMYSAGAVANALIPVIHNATKPVVITLMGELMIQEAVQHCRANRIPEYRFPERAASALAVLARRAEYLANSKDELLAFHDVNQELAQRLLTGAKPRLDSEGWLPQDVANALLQAYHIPTPGVRLVHSAEEAVEAARQAGLERLPHGIALKIDSPDILHKSDVGGVLLNLRSPEAILQGYQQIIQNARAAYPEATINGVFVQPMIPPGQEVIMGVVRDAQFGPLVMFGSGGVEVEGLKDVAFALAPLTQQEAEYLLENTWAGRKLKGFRNLPAADRLAVIQALARLAQMAMDIPEIAEIEINPLRALPQGQGVYALDVRARLAVASAG